MDDYDCKELLDAMMFVAVQALISESRVNKCWYLSRFEVEVSLIGLA